MGSLSKWVHLIEFDQCEVVVRDVKPELANLLMLKMIEKMEYLPELGIGKNQQGRLTHTYWNP